MKIHGFRMLRSAEHLPREDQLAWKIAEVAADPVTVEPAVTEMIINRIIDNAAAAAASLARRPVASARAGLVPSDVRRCHALRGGAGHAE